MRLQNVTLVVASGIASFLVVVVLATELAAPYVAFSLFVGIPVGLVAGVATAAVVALGLGPASEPGRRRVALSLGTFGVAFIVVLFGAAGGFGTGTVVALVAGAIVGLVAAAAAYFWFDSEQANEAVAHGR